MLLQPGTPGTEQEVVLPPPPPAAPALRPVFVVVLAIVALPILALFGADLLTDSEIESSQRIFLAPIFVLGCVVAPAVLWRRLIKRGAPPSNALAAALGLAIGVLALDLALFAGASMDAFLLVLIQLGLVVGILVWDRTRTDATPPPRSDRP